MPWTDASQNPHDYLAPGAGAGYSGGISGSYPIGIGGSYAGALNLGGAPSAGSVPNPLGRPTLPGWLTPNPTTAPRISGALGAAAARGGPRSDQLGTPVTTAQALAASALPSMPTGTGTGRPLSPAQENAIRQEAARLGIAPSNLAAVMDYETMGKMSTDITNPYGYKGLIQFGPTEQKAYGYQPGMSFEQQLFGPVHNYLVGRGLPSGANLSTLYRTINGGNPNASLNARDVNGTIAQHIERIGASSLPKYAYLDDGYSGQGSSGTMMGSRGAPNAATVPNPNSRPEYVQPGTGDVLGYASQLSAAPSPTNNVFRLPGANTPPPVSPAATPSIAGGQPYTVKPNDTLWGIAAQTLGDPSQWPTIAQANGIQRGQERNLQPGQQLLIPGGAPAAPPQYNAAVMGSGPQGGGYDLSNVPAVPGRVPTPQANPRDENYASGINSSGIPNPPMNPRRDPNGFRIDVNRPAINNPDGSISTERTITIGVGNGFVNIPTIVNGQQLTPEQAIAAFQAGQNPPVQGGFKTEAEAIAAAKARSPTIPGARSTSTPTGPRSPGWLGRPSGTSAADEMRWAYPQMQAAIQTAAPARANMPAQVISPADIGASDLTLTRARLLGRNDQNVMASPPAPSRGREGPGPVAPMSPQERAAIQQQLFDIQTRQRPEMGTPETQMSIDRPPSPPGPPAGPGMDLSGYIQPVSRFEQTLGRSRMALPTQPTPMDPSLAAAVNATPATITDRDLVIVAKRTAPVFVASNGVPIWAAPDSRAGLAKLPEDRGPSDAYLRQRGSKSRRDMNMDVGASRTVDRLKRDYPDRFLPGAPPLNENFINVTPYTSPVRRMGFPTDT